ncbi:MAG TPA: fumarate hydratase, partial [Roseococcus sp.]|nr:fumarate hydratase [Roseococcus sp.]
MTEKLHVAMDAVEEAAKLLYIRALKILPDDIKQGFARLDSTESDGLARSVLATMIENIAVAERTENLL